MQISSLAVLATVGSIGFAAGYVPPAFNHRGHAQAVRQSTKLGVSVGLGPEDVPDEVDAPLVEGVDYEVPDHELYRTSRRSRTDEASDQWFDALLGGPESIGVLGSVAEDVYKTLLTPVPLYNDIAKPYDDPEWTPYVSTKLPWTPLTPAFGLEQFGLPIPRRNAEAWRQFDTVGLTSQDYSRAVEGSGSAIEFSDEEVKDLQEKLDAAGAWLDDDTCAARLVYINGRYAPQLSKATENAQNIAKLEDAPEDVAGYLTRLTDGFTDELAAPVPSGETDFLTSFKTLSGPDHCMGNATTQFAINTQQGTACFAALNTYRTGAVAHIHLKEGQNPGKPIMLVNAVTPDGGAVKGEGDSDDKGVASHPRCVVVADERSNLSFVQSSVDLDTGAAVQPKLYNGYTQVFVKEDANVTHSYIDESGGMPTPGVELKEKDLEEGAPLPRTVEANRPELKDSHLEAVDVHLVGERALYDGVIMSIGGSGRVRISHYVSLLKPEATAKVNGFSLSGGAQVTECKTNIHHIAQATNSEQLQKNMVGGRATGSFRGRIRVEQSAQQTDSQQLSRSVLLNDVCKTWTVPSLEIIADDVVCTHGATVSDLSEEELFYLRSRGLDQSAARNMLMYAFAGEACAEIDKTILGETGSKKGLQARLLRRLDNVVPEGDRALQGEFQSV